ncbi:MAG: dTDP-4-dehydrorhamnose reductase [Candidatus Omnitrophota bacterium]|nr:dTDP-4-dehydrorhamnose reductase [Candidatus Omnitrophota bacterium]
MVEKAKGKILITGAEGMLGSNLFQELTNHYSLVATTQKDLDITDAKKVKQVILSNQPWIVIHTAALTDVDGCESQPRLAYNANALGTKNIVEATKIVGCLLFFLSSDYVFDGESNKPYKEEAIPNPINVYGETKLEAEKFVATALNSFVIIRSSWLFGKGKIGFVEKILQQAKTEGQVRVVADKYGSPTYVKDLAKAILTIIYLIEKGQFIPEKSFLHITNSGFCSWLEYAKKVIELSKIEGVSLVSISPEEFNFKAKRPRFSVLDNSRYNKLTGKPQRPWQEALGEYLRCLAN